MKGKSVKYFNGERYLIHHGRWERSSRDHILLSHDVWNYHHLDDLITKGDGFVIHHINKKPDDDRIDNLQKMIDFEHRSLHHKNKKGLVGEKNPAWKGGKENRKLYQKMVVKRKPLFALLDRKNHFSYRDEILINLNTLHITISHSWGYY